MHSYDVHEPYDAPAPWQRTFNDRSFEELGRDLGYPPVPWQLTQRLASLSDEDVETVRDLYDNGIRAADAAFRELVGLLGEHDLFEHAIVVVLSDHGEEFLEHGSFNHGHSVHREVIRVPLWIRLPAGQRGGRVVAGPVALIDVAPTVLELAGLPVPAEFAGRSLAGLIHQTEGDSWLAEREIRFESPNRRRGDKGMRVGDFVILKTLRGRELYDVSSDPHERTDLARREPALARRLWLRLQRGDQALEQQGKARGWHGVPREQAPSPDQRKRLRTLGYVEDGTAP